MQRHSAKSHPIAARLQNTSSTKHTTSIPRPIRNTVVPGQSGDNMEPTFKNKKNRLTTFAVTKQETNGDSQKGHTEHPVVPVETSSEQRSFGPVPLRQTITSPPRIPNPAGRNTAPPLERNSFSQPPQSTTLPFNGRPRANSDDHRGDLFDGSQLGESFMNSGLTTPRNEPADPVELNPELIQDLKKTIPSRSKPDYGQFNRQTKNSFPERFAVADNGHMNVVTQHPRHGNISHMNDGFQKTTINNRGRQGAYYQEEAVRPALPARQDPKQAKRQIVLRHNPAGRSEVYDRQAHDRSPSPTVRDVQLSTHHREDSRRLQELYTEEPEADVRDDEHMTPKPKKVRLALQTAPVENSITPDTAPISRDKKRRRPEPEYDDSALKSMNFDDLLNQPFDFDPSKEEQKGAGINADNLAAKLDQFRHLGEREQHDVFSGMSVSDWEKSGEWFVDQFAGLMQKLTAARRDKRRIIELFEEEAAAREESVRLKTQSIDQKLRKMKQDGQRVVEDKGV